MASPKNMDFVAVAAVAAACFLLTFRTDVCQAATWSYDGENGPHYWHKLFPQACSGKYQSPIDIRPEQTKYNHHLNDFAIWYDPPRPGSTMAVKNNGHTVLVATSGELYVANGGLPYVYRTSQFHFHWGHAKHHGSEHLIDSKAFPLELHIVSYNSDLYSSIAQAVTEKQGLAILAVLFEVSEKDNKDLEPIISAMDQIQDPEVKNEVMLEAMSLRNLLPADSSQYYRYNGSLTTPGCFESVVWTVFAQPRPISHRQLHKFRKQLQMRHRYAIGSSSKGKHHQQRRSASKKSMMPVTAAHRRQERRALEVLEELALNPKEAVRFRRELTKKKQHVESTVAKIDEVNARLSHLRMLEAVHQAPTMLQEELNQTLSEVEVEYVQERLVNNFRPVQPLNDRVVLRSFRHLKDRGHKRHSHSPHSETPADQQKPNERHELHNATDGNNASTTCSVSSSMFLLVSCLIALFF